MNSKSIGFIKWKTEVIDEAQRVLGYSTDVTWLVKCHSCLFDGYKEGMTPKQYIAKQLENTGD